MPNLFALLVRHPIGVSLLAMGLLLTGALAYALLGVAMLPSIVFPQLSVVTQMPGANAQNMAATVTAPLERRLGALPGLDEMYSSSQEGLSMINLRFIANRSVDSAARDVQTALNAAQPDLPSGLPEPPEYFKADSNAFPVMLIAMTSASLSPDRLYDLADTLAKPVLARVPGVARVEVSGGSQHGVRISLDLAALAIKGLTANDVRNVLVAANVNAPEGMLQHGSRQLLLRTNAALHTVKDFAGLVLKNQDGVIVRLADVARVESGPQDIYQMAWFNGQRSVNLEILKRPEANAVETAQALRVQLPQLQHLLPGNVKITPTFDLTRTTQSALTEVKTSLLISLALVIFIMWVFLRRTGPTLIASLNVPLSLAGTFLAMWALGYSLNTFSMMALVLCIGFVVDDAIVVIENIVRHLEAGESSHQASLRGVGEIGFTVLAITLSLIAVFAPLLFGDSLLVRLLREFSVTLTTAVVISAIVSLTVTPALCHRYLKQRQEVPSAAVDSSWQRLLVRFDTGLLAVYREALEWALRHRRLMRWQPLLMLVASLGLAMAVIKTAGATFMPEEDNGILNARVQADLNISPKLLAKRFYQAISLVQADPAVARVIGSLGSFDAGSAGAVGNQGRMFIDLKPYGMGLGQRHEHMQVIMQRLSERFKHNDLDFSIRSFNVFNDGSGGDQGGQYSFQLISENGGDLQPWTSRMVRGLRQLPGFSAVSSNNDQALKLDLLHVDRDHASRLGVSMGDIDSALYMSLGQSPVSVIYDRLNQYQAVLTSTSVAQADTNAILNTYVRATAVTDAGKNAGAALVPLAALGSIEPSSVSRNIEHQNQLQVASISYNLEQGITPDRSMRLVRETAAGLGLPAGMRVAFTGENKNLDEVGSKGVSLLLGAICAMYIVLGMLYESLIHPLTILSTLPAAGAGALLAMLLTQTPLSLIAIIAVLLLIGIVKKNAIMMVDFALKAEREQGVDSVAAIRQAALVRFRPIMMTTLVAMGAALPLAMGFGVGSEMRQPLGIAIVGGLLVSQGLTLLSTPAIYLWLYDRRQHRAAKAAARA